VAVISLDFARQVYARRRHAAATLATASRKRDLRLIELTPQELQLLRRADELYNRLRAEEEEAAQR
jgi:hypothetical protein